MKSYSSNYPNQVHLMSVVASKHLYLLADGRIKYQDKPIETKLEKVSESPKNVLVHMVIADHTSGTIYGETFSSRDMLDPVGFLRRAWNRKEHTFFCGVPEFLSVPKVADGLWPEIRAYATTNLVDVVNPTSGFQGGAIHPRLWEKEIQMWGLYGTLEAHRDLASLSRYCQKSCNEHEPTRKQRWFAEVPGRPELRFPKD